ncbi:ABC transporter permease [Amycolatopsis cynarae]|uniref:ABC transporter permease n=1 Tax=Amycolatopsis cynarae TaxID=2995223 RepID=A0ABY7AUR3_9PSEU|nr:ABC transporter permease [Amycolatopsis sp. HUAS 11-8]WAL63449.1 ABC transporter permease [Amycolatopsis sp. HUAS 11-8]
MKVVFAEFRKLFSLPSAYVAIGLSLAGTLGIAAANVSSLRAKLDSGNLGPLPRVGTLDAGFATTVIGTIGVIVLGVVVVSSEYSRDTDDAARGRQIITTLVALPRRGALIAAKALVVALTSGVLAAVTIPATILLSQSLLGRHGHPAAEVMSALAPRAAGEILYWVLTALLTFAVTTLVRSGVVPMVVLITNTSLVSVTLLLARWLPPARYLPDVAGAQMFAVGYPAPDMLSPVSGGVVMALWTFALLVAAAIVFARRDA